MKKLILSTAVLIALSLSSMAAVNPTVNDKAQKTFNEVFKNADEVKWNDLGKNYEAFFLLDGIKTRALLDANGNLIHTIRYYDATKLPPVVLTNIQSDYKGKEVFGVTEVNNTNGIQYRIVLKDDKYFIHINANSAGDTYTMKKYKRGDK